MFKRSRSSGSWSTASCVKTRVLAVGVQSGGSIGLIAALIFLASFSLAGCSSLTGWNIPGTEKSAIPTTKVYLVLENVETVAEEVRSQGEIYVDDAFFGHTSRPFFSKFVGNDLVVGTVQTEKQKVHNIEVVYPGYEAFEHERYFGALPEYSISFRLKRLPGEPVAAPPPEPQVEEEQEEKWYEFWKWFGGQ